ncbi:fatty-acid-binding protein 3, chloroplastic [Oryza glaberrima]|uniref:fatty-acid-binding protein 3, chloroplastic n=1 Tax=Oryza glaberrima TaxID=4538 RepID=UPI00224C104D|nr:fatty-acid-binding protein 3, chloroplastic [Oryza glaberrima]
MSAVPVVSSALAGPAVAVAVAVARPASGSVTRLRAPAPHGVPAGSVPFASGLANCYRRSAAAARRLPIPSAAGGGTVGDAFVIEDTTNVKFPREIAVPGYTEPLVILGTGYREKFFLKIYAAAFYVDCSIGVDTMRWREKVGIETFDASSVFDSIFKAPVVKSLSIILVRDVDGKTFVKALDDIIARQIKKPSAEEEQSLSTFQKTFLGRSLKQGTTVYLTWLEPSKLLISIAGNQDPCQVDAEITSATVNYALYDGFLGSSPVSPTLRSSTALLLEAILTK